MKRVKATPRTGKAGITGRQYITAVVILLALSACGGNPEQANANDFPDEGYAMITGRFLQPDSTPWQPGSMIVECGPLNAGSFLQLRRGDFLFGISHRTDETSFRFVFPAGLGVSKDAPVIHPDSTFEYLCRITAPVDLLAEGWAARSIRFSPDKNNPWVNRVDIVKGRFEDREGN